MADICEEGSVLIPFLHGYCPSSFSPSHAVCAHKFCGCELPVVLCLYVCVCLSVYLCICYLNILFCQRKSFASLPGQAKAGEKATGPRPDQDKTRQGRRRRRRGSSLSWHVRFVLPICRMLKVFTFFIATSKELQPAYTCVCVCVSVQAKPLHVSGAWPNRFLLIFWDFSGCRTWLKGTLTHVAMRQQPQLLCSALLV